MGLTLLIALALKLIKRRTYQTSKTKPSTFLPKTHIFQVLILSSSSYNVNIWPLPQICMKSSSSLQVYSSYPAKYKRKNKILLVFRLFFLWSNYNGPSYIIIFSFILKKFWVEHFYLEQILSNEFASPSIVIECVSNVDIHVVRFL